MKSTGGVKVLRTFESLDDGPGDPAFDRRWHGCPSRDALLPLCMTFGALHHQHARSRSRRNVTNQPSMDKHAATKQGKKYGIQTKNR